MKVTDVFGSKKFRAAKRAIDIKYTRGEKAIKELGSGVPGLKDVLAALPAAYQKEVQKLYANPESAVEAAPKKVAAKKAAKKAPAKKKAAAKKEPVDTADLA